MDTLGEKMSSISCGEGDLVLDDSVRNREDAGTCIRVNGIGSISAPDSFRRPGCVLFCYTTTYKGMRLIQDEKMKNGYQRSSSNKNKCEI